MKPEDGKKFEDLRAFVFDKIKKSLEEDGHCKSYEGAFEITKCYPNYFEEESGEDKIFWVLKLHCYVFGPSRHYDWSGETFAEALDKADREIRGWAEEEI